MTSTNDFSKKQLAAILSALDDAPRSPANKGEALRAIGRSAQRFGLTADDVLACAPGLIDGRMSPAEFRGELQDLGNGTPVLVTDAPQGAPDAQEKTMADQEPQAPTDPAQAAQAPAAARGKAKTKPAKATKTAIADVARLLRRERIGAVVVTEADRLCGIISERDLARGLADYGAELLEMKVGQLMTSEVVTCTPEDGIDHLMQSMTHGRFRHLPVLQDGRMIGIISIGDVVKHRLEELEAETHQLQDYIGGAV